jgi:hypothetical protein
MGNRIGMNSERGMIGLSTEFEWDEDRWLFRRGGRAAPVQVSREEMIQSVSIYENLTLAIIALLSVGGLFVLLAMGRSNGPSGEGSSDLLSLLIFIGFIIGLFLTLTIARRLAARKFDGRRIVGPPRSHMELRLIRIREKSWSGLFASFGFFSFIIALHLPPSERIDWLMIALMLLAAGNNAFNAVLKWRMRPTAPAPV